MLLFCSQVVNSGFEIKFISSYGRGTVFVKGYWSCKRKKKIQFMAENTLKLFQYKRQHEVVCQLLKVSLRSSSLHLSFMWKNLLTGFNVAPKLYHFFHLQQARAVKNNDVWNSNIFFTDVCSNFNCQIPVHIRDSGLWNIIKTNPVFVSAQWGDSLTEHLD